MENKNKRVNGTKYVIFFLVTSLFVVPAQGAVTTHHQSLQKTMQNKAWTTLYYLDVDYDTNNYDVLEDVFRDELRSTDNVNVFVIQDKENEPAFLYSIDGNHNKTILEELGEVDMGDPQTLSDFITYGKEHYPADRYLLYVYDHGGGWKGACMDTTNNDSLLTMDEFHQALTSAGGVDIICYFACLMASLEAAYELRDVVNVYIGSEDLAWMSWWDGVCGATNDLLTTTPELSTEQAGSSIVHFFPEQSNANLNVLTMTALRTSKIAAVTETLHTLVKQYTTHWFRSYKAVKTAHDNTYLLANYESWAPVFETYDLKSFIQSLPSTPQTTAVLTAINESIITEVHGGLREKAYGLSIFFPANISLYKLGRAYKDNALGLDFPKDTWWNEFLFFFIATNTILRK